MIEAIQVATSPLPIGVAIAARSTPDVDHDQEDDDEEGEEEAEPPSVSFPPASGVPSSTLLTTGTPRSAKSRRAPATVFRRHPPKVLRTEELLARAVFRFGSNEAGVVFLCRLDREPFHPCRRTIIRHLAPGPHALRVKAPDAGGNTYRTPAVYRFHVERVG